MNSTQTNIKETATKAGNAATNLMSTYGRRAFKSTPFKAPRARVQAASMSAAGARGRITASNRGFVRIGGFYGRFRGRRATSVSEMKFKDTTRGYNVVPDTGVVDTNVVVIPQGDGESERVGRKCTIRSIYFKGSATLESATATNLTDDFIRLMVIQDKQTNGAAFTVGNVLVTANFLAHKNLENEKRFRVLSDQMINLNTTVALDTGGGDAGGERNRTWIKYLRCNIPIEYDSSAATGAIATQRSNSIAVLAITQNSLTNLQYVCRVRYTDN